jgi:hypothetical protein
MSNEFSSAAVDKTLPSRDENVVQRKYKHRRQRYFVCVTEMGVGCGAGVVEMV